MKFFQKTRNEKNTESQNYSGYNYRTIKIIFYLELKILGHCSIVSKIQRGLQISHWCNHRFLDNSKWTKKKRKLCGLKVVKVYYYFWFKQIVIWTLIFFVFFFVDPLLLKFKKALEISSWHNHSHEDH